MADVVTYSRRDSWAELRISNPPVNALSLRVIDGLIEGFRRFEQDDATHGLIIRCDGRTFVAGGDIAMFDDPAFSPTALNDLLNRIAASPRPVVAALFGTVLGGGLELALACRVRIAAEGTTFGMPEIKLGLIPGSHGTQRLPRLIGLVDAARLISTGDPIALDKALALGLVDGVADSEDDAAIIAVAANAPGASRRNAGADAADGREVLAGLRATAAARPLEPAYQAIAETLSASVERSFDEGTAIEADWFSRLMSSAPSRAQRHLFFAERTAAVVPDLPPGIAPRPVERVAVLGAGTMGTGIARSVALGGYKVYNKDNAQDRVEKD